ncbi:M35 family metallo-endopeptidase [Xenophilus arseniciresistens]|uniref:M35 family metallo-endopeptidase n=1 Tax=Xenophilus arseniciresistens TaxID=1283306 RepID=A0AAE3NA15_9BURK|nr:M35 family metallo-endopeptidase [Xenophilus arseniciresistens]MDA7418830.1 M35 family metallo-endopeptidase [Xenophilus arseniciresistens]
MNDETAEAICPSITNQEFARRVLRLRDVCIDKIGRRLLGLRRWDAAEQARVTLWFGKSDAGTRAHLERGYMATIRVLEGLGPENFVRFSADNMRKIGCVTDNSQRSSDVAAAVCRPDTATHTIAINLGFCSLRESSGMTDSQLSTLLHEVTHFEDTFASTDLAYTMWSALRLAKSNSAVAFNNADNLVGYVIHEG